MSEELNNTSKYKQILRSLLGDRSATWIHAGRFAYLLVFTNKLYAELDLDLLEHFAMKGAIAIDVGANSANWTNILSKQIGKDGKVYAFEADPYYAEVTKKTIRLLGLRNVRFFNFGLSDQPEILRLEIFDDLGQRVSGTGKIIQKESLHENRTIKVKLEPLDELANAYPDLWRAKLIKCDVEGFELKVFNGAIKILERARPIVIAEVGDSVDVKNSSPTLFDFYNNLGYKSYVTVSNNMIRPSRQGGDIPEGQRPNRIFIPEEYPIPKSVQIDQ
jgi:FkbM family methyltransferase